MNSQIFMYVSRRDDKWVGEVKINKLDQLELPVSIRRASLLTARYSTSDEAARAVDRYGFVLTMRVCSMCIKIYSNRVFHNLKN